MGRGSVLSVVSVLAGVLVLVHDAVVVAEAAGPELSTEG